MAVKPGSVSVSWSSVEGALSLSVYVSGARPGSLKGVFLAVADLCGSGVIVQDSGDAESRESDPAWTEIGSCSESDLGRESDQSDQGIGSGNRINRMPLIYFSCSQIAEGLGISRQAVRKRAKGFEGGRKRRRGKGMEYPLSSLPGRWQAALLTRLYGG